MGDRGLLDEILTIFIEQAETLAAVLCEIPDDETWREAAHKLKGASRGVGAWALGDLAEAAELATVEEIAAKQVAAERIKHAAIESVEYAKSVRDRKA